MLKIVLLLRFWGLDRRRNPEKKRRIGGTYTLIFVVNLQLDTRQSKLSVRSEYLGVSHFKKEGVFWFLLMRGILLPSRPLKIY